MISRLLSLQRLQPPFISVVSSYSYAKTQLRVFSLHHEASQQSHLIGAYWLPGLVCEDFYTSGCV